MKGRALRRALATGEANRISGDVPLIVDTTELISPERAQEMLTKNHQNRPIHWQKVEEYARAMEEGRWRLHAQGIILDRDDNILTGQTRLWAVIYSGATVYFRVSRGTPPDAGRLIDRGIPQSALDLATRITGRKHSPVELRIARAGLARQKIVRASRDTLAEWIEQHGDPLIRVLALTRGMKKDSALLMLLAILVSEYPTRLIDGVQHLDGWAATLDARLTPASARSAWNRGGAFVAALSVAGEIVSHTLTT